VDWVGVDLYPQTWTSTDRHGPRAAAAAMRAELRYLRHFGLPSAGIPRRARLHVSENGFPTGPTRDEAQQAELMVAAIEAVAAVSRRYGVSDYRWFGLRDANSSDQSFESQYGVLRDDYTPKQGFDELRALIARLGASR
jgi:DNA-binding transcriptional MocR family regulator